MRPKAKKVWTKVVFASELPSCPDCGETWCPKHKKHYADCACIGPTQSGVEFRIIKGELYGRAVQCKR